MGLLFCMKYNQIEHIHLETCLSVSLILFYKYYLICVYYTYHEHKKMCTLVLSISLLFMNFKYVVISDLI